MGWSLWVWGPVSLVGRVGVAVRGWFGCPALLLERCRGPLVVSGCEAETVAAVERVDELFGPRPAGRDA